MKSILSIVLAIVVFITSCDNNNTEKDDDMSEDPNEDFTSQSVEPETDNAGKANIYGKHITADNAVDIITLASNPSDAASYKGKVTGTVTSACQNKGCWFEMDMGKGETMMVTFKDYGFFVPKDISGKKVVVEGVAETKTISVDEQKHYAMDAGKDEAEINSITQSETELSFVADGVLIL